MPERAAASPHSVLVLRHERFEHLGYFAETLNDLHIPFVYSDLNDKLDLGPHDGLIVMGGPQSANDPDMSAEMHFIRQVIDEKYPVLGICLGAQLIAKALGAQVYRNREKEIGWAPVHFSESAHSDPLLGGLESPQHVFSLA